MFCKNCGSMIPDGVNFCPNCGTPASIPAGGQAARTAEPAGNPFEESPKRGPEPAASDENQAGQTYYNQNDTQTGYDPNAYSQPYGSNNSYGGAPIQSRSIALCIILSIITCGIYMIYWQIVMVNDFNIVTEEPEETSGGMVFLFSLITCGIYMIYWMYKAGNRMDNLKMRLGHEKENRGIVYLLLTIFGLSIVAYALIQNELNNIAEGTY